MTLRDMISRILRTEGGYVNHPKDRGGPTKYGITQETLSEWRGYWVTEQEVKDLEEPEAREIYRDKYFYGPKIDRLPEPIQLLVFDCSINHGPSQALMFVQIVCVEAEIAYLKVDGVNGPKTRAAADKAQREMGDYLTNAIVEERIAFYKAIVRGNASQKVFLRGWLDRANSFRIRDPQC